MKTLHTSCVLISFIVTSLGLSAQGLYLKLGGSYQQGISSQNMYSHTFNDNQDLEERQPLALGQGFSTQFAAGYMFKPNFGVELGLAFHQGASFSSTSKGYESSFKATFQSDFYLINPSLVFALPQKNFQAYTKFGPLIGFGSIYQSIEDRERGFFESDLEVDIEASGGFFYGAHAAVGIDYKLTDRLAFFSELNLRLAAYSPKEGEVTKYRLDGQNQLNNLSDSERYIRYVDQVDYNQSSPPDEPSKALGSAFSLSSIGLQLGLRYRF